ncbi:MAG TPA: HEAT repeat domain-containing protein [Gammaproteobacteria bacterium]|nr:HEAT repeat domain-containing protein [Gammaproteobacteria bacterium]
MTRALLLVLGLLMSLGGALETAAADAPPAAQTGPKSSLSHADQQRVRIALLTGRASLADVRLALTERNVSYLTNTLHALYNMRWHRGVWHLLDDVWAGKRDAYPELSWDLLEKPPARVALASTLIRIKIVDTREYQEYIRSQKDARHEFTRAQVAVALGFNGDPDDIPLLRKYAEGSNPYVAQSAITGLGLMGSDPAKKTLAELRDAFKDKEPARSKLIAEVLDAAYKRPQSTAQKLMAPAPQTR